jgi:hypothetical protein
MGSIGTLQSWGYSNYEILDTEWNLRRSGIRLEQDALVCDYIRKPPSKDGIFSKYFSVSTASKNKAQLKC